MKVMTILGTRPEIIRLSLVIKKLDRYCDHVLVNSGQNYSSHLNSIFFKELGVRKPDYHMGVRAPTFGEQIGEILTASEKIFLKEKPDKLLVLGDTNSALVSIIAKRLGIRVYHMEAGNRCYDDRVPEEVNRRIIDHSSDILMPYTQNSKENLLREGLHGKNIYVTGNPIYEVIRNHEDQIQASTILKTLGLQENRYFLVTAHREENVDNKERLMDIMEALNLIQKKYKMPIICSLHPRTKKKMQKFRLANKNRELKFLTPLGFFDFVALEKKVFCVISDSGTVQEECCLFRVANVTIRDVTERPETVACGSNILSGVKPESILRCITAALKEPKHWVIPSEYMREHVSTAVVKIIVGKV
jgi:UDP-N-acetylglucosamine 2-epimerase (non-hydrolysing)